MGESVKNCRRPSSKDFELQIAISKPVTLAKRNILHSYFTVMYLHVALIVRELAEIAKTDQLAPSFDFHTFVCFLIS